MAIYSHTGVFSLGELGRTLLEVISNDDPREIGIGEPFAMREVRKTELGLLGSVTSILNTDYETL